MSKNHLRYNWKTFVNKMEKANDKLTPLYYDEDDDSSVLGDRLDVLAYCREAFHSSSFAEMTDDQRIRIAGLIKKVEGEPDFGYFGRMAGAGYFKGAINKNHPAVSEALDLIPLEGEVSKVDYLAYIEKLKEPFAETGGLAMATATRLLAMKRPDYFLCLDNENVNEIGELLNRNFPHNRDISMAPKYWEDIVESLREYPWCGEPKPIDEYEEELAMGRVAIVDMLSYRLKASDHDKLI